MISDVTRILEAIRVNAELVKLRYFAGLTTEQAAASLGSSANRLMRP